MKHFFCIVNILSIMITISCHGKDNRVASPDDSTALKIQAKITGTWASIGDLRATFVIGENKIFYPDHNQSYEYHLFKDSIRIRYEDLEVNYNVITRGPDTLILVGADAQVFYRFSY